MRVDEQNKIELLEGIYSNFIYVMWLYCKPNSKDGYEIKSVIWSLADYYFFELFKKSLSALNVGKK